MTDRDYIKVLEAEVDKTREWFRTNDREDLDQADFWKAWDAMIAARAATDAAREAAGNRE